MVFDINLGKFSGTIVSNIFSIPFFLPLCVRYTFCSCPTVLGSSGFLFFFPDFIFFLFQFLRILLIHHLVQRFLSQQRLIYWAHQRCHFCYGGAFFKICSISFGFFLGITYLSAYTAHLSLHATLSLEPLVSSSQKFQVPGLINSNILHCLDLMLDLPLPIGFFDFCYAS